MSHNLSAKIKKLESAIRAREAERAKSLPDPFWRSFAIKPGEPGFGRIAKAILDAAGREVERRENTPSDGTPDFPIVEICLQAALAEDANIRDEMRARQAADAAKAALPHNR